MFELASSHGSLTALVLALGVAGALKSVSALCFGEWNALERNSFTHWKLGRRYGLAIAWIVGVTHKPALICRGIAGVALVIGVLPGVMSLVLCISLLGELAWRFRYNHVLCVLCSVIVFAALSLAPLVEGEHYVCGWPGASRWVVVIMLFSLYWSSCLEKIRSDSFASGWTLRAIVIDRAIGRRPGMPWEYPSLLSRVATRVRAASDRWFRVVALTVILMEFSLPVLVSFDKTYTVGVALAVVLHLSFAILQPFHLLPFQFLSVSFLAAFPLITIG